MLLIIRVFSLFIASSIHVCFFPLYLILRAGEQEKLDSQSVNITLTQSNHNVTKELDLDFYLGIYAGEDLNIVT